ncbi:MAG: FAD-binding protein [Acidimicrobiia bacterium]|nr:FAD-binding protein [Acidimicrobiia bacterium]
MNDDLAGFVADVGPSGPVCVRGGGTQWHVGGAVASAATTVWAPIGVVEYEPEEMTVIVGAGTPVADLHVQLALAGQRTNLVESPGSSVGGALVVGRDGVHTLGRGRARDALLQARYVSAEGALVTAGGPTVKNVTGFDLCRLLVGSLGTLGLLGEVILRTQPIPAAARWLQGEVDDPRVVARTTRTASAVLWDGTTTWVHLEGHGTDLDTDAAALPGAFVEVDGPPTLPTHAWSMAPAELVDLDPSATGPFVAEIGVGTVHATAPCPPVAVPDALRRLNQSVRDRFDPDRRLNPGRDPLAA